MIMRQSSSYLLGALLIVAPALAMAQQPNSGDAAGKPQTIQTAETGWQAICRSTPQDRSKMTCSVMHETYSSQDRVRLTSVEIVKTDKGRTMLVSVPQGVNLKEGIDFSIDGTKQSRLTYNYCMNNNCFSTLELTDAHINSLKKSKAMDIVFFDLQGSKIKTEIFMTGFTQAMAKSD